MPWRSTRAAALLLVYLIAVIAGFLAPYDPEAQNRTLAFVPPSRIRFVDAQRRVHLRPFIYPVKPIAGSPDAYQEDRSQPQEVDFLMPGSAYKMLGLFQMRLHLFGVGGNARIFLLGTDALGRDVFSRLLYGGQISLFAALLASVTSVSIGLVLGGVAGYYGAWIDELIMRASEVFLAVPWLYLLLAVRACLPLRLSPAAVFLLLMLVAGSVAWGRPARLVRGLILSARDREYVLAARGFGASDLYILRRHLLPEAYPVALTQAALYIPQYITAEVTLSFFGLGVSEPAASWGNMLAQLRTLFVLENCWWMFAPAAALVLVLLLFQFSFSTELNRFEAPILPSKG